MAKVIRVVLILLALTSVWLTYDNVLSDEVPIVGLAEKAACVKKKCADHHQMTRLGRTPIGVSVEFTWPDGPVSLTCRRTALLLGERVCTIDG